jgi:FHA domain
MTVTCPNGHASVSDDYCDQCGIRLGQISSPRLTKQGEEKAETKPGEPASLGCPACGDRAELGARFCETCGADLAQGGPPPPGPNEAVEWQLTASCDPEYFAQVEASSVELPPSPSDQTFPLNCDRVAIGRHGDWQPEEQAIDLSGAAADAGVSRRHALLARQADGGWTVIDCHSTNGTFLNDSPNAISSEEPVCIREGDQLHLGAWTTITLRRVPGRSLDPPRREGSKDAG